MKVRRLVSRVSVGALAFSGLCFAACVADQSAGGPSAEDSGTGNDSSVSGDASAGGDAGGDAGSDSATGSDAGDGSVKSACNMTAPFTNIHAVTELNTIGNDQHARLSQDELAVWFASTGLDAGPGGGSYDLFHGTRALTTAPFSNIKAVAGPNTIYSEDAPAVNGDPLQLVYASTLSTSGATYDLYRSTQSAVDAGFQAGVNLSISVAGKNDLDPYLSADDQTLYFASDRGSSYTLYRAPHSGGNVFGAATVVSELSSGVADSHPVISADGLWIYWSSQRVDIGGHKGGDDVYVAHRTTVPGTFVQITNVTELNTVDNEMPSWISPDGCRLYFARKAASTSDIWLAERAL